MKTLKIAFLLMAIIVLALSGVSSNEFQSSENPEITPNETHINIIAHTRDKVDLPGNG